MRRHAPPDFVKEVHHQHHVILHFARLRACPRHHHQEALTVGSKIEGYAQTDVCKLLPPRMTSSCLNFAASASKVDVEADRGSRKNSTRLSTALTDGGRPVLDLYLKHLTDARYRPYLIVEAAGDEVHANG